MADPAFDCWERADWAEVAGDGDDAGFEMLGHGEAREGRELVVGVVIAVVCAQDSERLCWLWSVGCEELVALRARSCQDPASCRMPDRGCEFSTARKGNLLAR